MKRLVPVLFAALLGAPFAAGAQTFIPADPPVDEAGVASQDAAATPAVTEAVADRSSDSKKSRADSPYCLRHTGSLIRQDGRQRCTGYGQSYSRDDLRLTGETDMADALRKLSSSIH